MAYQPVTIGGAIRAAATRAPRKTAILFEGMALDYATLVERMNRVANAALGRGIGAGDVVALIAPNCLPYLEVVAGLSDVGIAVATLNPALTIDELSAIFADCRPRLLLVHPDVALDRDRLAALAPILALDAYEPWLAAASPALQPPRIEETDSFSVSYTSGTTGRPKGVLLPHRSRVLTVFAMAAEFGCFGPDEHFLSISPLYHGAGFVFALANVMLGGTTEILPSFNAERVAALLGEGRATGIFVVPTILKRLVDLPAASLVAAKRNRLKAIISNAAALPQPLKQRTVAVFGEGLLFESYGSTEGGIVTVIRPPDQLRTTNSVGLPFALTEVELRDDGAMPVAPGVAGELFSRSPYHFNGYLNRPQETAETMRDGWVSVGDIAVRDEEGFYHIVDRKKDMIVSGGVNIYPREVENLLVELPGIADAAVVGVPDAEWGECVHAFLVADTGATIDPVAIAAACRERLSGYKCPRAIHLIDALPRNAGGKVLKTALRARAAEPG